jgi:DNA-binding transcriptional MerR regulator
MIKISYIHSSIEVAYAPGEHYISRTRGLFGKREENVMKMEKRTFRIGELAHHLELQQFVIRFWEKEFNFKSHRSQGGQRFYTETDLQRFERIKEMLYTQGLTIAGAKKQLNEQESIFMSSSTTTLKVNETPATETLVAEAAIETRTSEIVSAVIIKTQSVESEPVAERIQPPLDNNAEFIAQLKEVKVKLQKVYEML